ncbi:hypothetical protein S83_065876, partial [Arachis hypogaea]
NDEEENMAPKDEKELALDSGFVVPHFNSFGHRFRFISSYKYDIFPIGCGFDESNVHHK